MTATYGGVLAVLTRCTVLDRDGQPCGHAGHPKLPPGVCEQHAIAITRAVLRMGGITIKESTR